jgi:hypothetical protein
MILILMIRPVMILGGGLSQSSTESLSNSREDDEIWKHSYYKEKFGEKCNDPFFIDDLKQSYVVCFSSHL